MGKLGLGVVPPRVQEIMDRHERTGKITTKQRQKLDHHFLLQRARFPASSRLPHRRCAAAPLRAPRDTNPRVPF